MKRYWWVCLLLAACQPSDGTFLAIDPLPPPDSADLGVPLRVTAVGGTGVQLDVTQGKLGDGTSSGCLDLSGSNSAIVIVQPDSMEALVVGTLFAKCADAGAPPNTKSEAPSTPILAEAEVSVRAQGSNPPSDAGVDGPVTSGVSGGER